MEQPTPWFAELQCSICTAEAGPDGAFVQGGIVFCRVCGVTVMRLLYALLFGSRKAA